MHICFSSCFTPIAMQTHEAKQFDWLWQMNHLRWCPGEVKVLYVSTIPTLYLKLCLESHVQCNTSSALLWSTQWSTQMYITWCVYRVPTEYRESEQDKCLYTYLYNITYMYHLTMHLTWLHIMWPTPCMGHRGYVGIMLLGCYTDEIYLSFLCSTLPLLGTYS